jgi:hypothetical protein
MGPLIRSPVASVNVFQSSLLIKTYLVAENLVLPPGCRPYPTGRKLSPDFYSFALHISLMMVNAARPIKRGLSILLKPLIFVVRQAGFEPAAYGFVVRRSIRAELLAHVKTD